MSSSKPINSAALLRQITVAKTGDERPVRVVWLIVLASMSRVVASRLGELHEALVNVARGGTGAVTSSNLVIKRA